MVGTVDLVGSGFVRLILFRPLVDCPLLILMVELHSETSISFTFHQFLSLVSDDIALVLLQQSPQLHIVQPPESQGLSQ